MFSFQQNQRAREQNKFCLEAGWGGVGEQVTQTMYTHVSKCKNDKIKEKKDTHTQNILHFGIFFHLGRSVK
jgi:hypothetical protein